jgi:hypothetical protein
MDSPFTQSSIHFQRMRAHSNLSVHSADSRGGIRKRTPSLSRSTSNSHLDRLYQLALEQSNSSDASGAALTSAAHWLTPQASPQPHVFSDTQVEPFPEWTVPTPPRSDSGLPTVSVDANEVPVTTGISCTVDYPFDQQPTASAEMRSVLI